MTRQRLLFFLRLAVGCGLLVALLVRIDWQEGVALLQRLDYWGLFFAWMLFPSGIALSVYKWRILLVAQGLSYAFWRLLNDYWIGFFANNFFPSSIGGDLSRIVLLQGLGNSAKVAASILIERLSGLLILLAWSACALSILSDRLALPVFVVLASAVVVGILLAVLLLFGVEWWTAGLERILAGIQASLLRSGTEFLLNLSRAMAPYHQQRVVIWQAVWLSIPFYVTPLLLQYILLRGSGLNISLLDIFAIVPLINLVGMLPLTPNAIGIMEGAYVFFYGLAGIPPGEALAVALCVRFLGLLASAVGGGLWLVRRGEKQSVEG